jgi:PAS domain S-box-containing protein
MSQDTMEVLCRRIVEEVPDAVVFADREGIIRLWNAGAAEMFGHAADEAVGKSLDLIIPEKLRERHWEGYRRTMETGETKYGKDLLAVPGIRNDGSRISLEFSVAMIRGDSGELQGIVAVLRDVTARWTKEKELKERLASLEAQR